MRVKSAFTKRRVITGFVLCVILTVTFFTGFSRGIESDGNVYVNEGERIVMWEDLPGSGTPSDFDALATLRYVAQRVYTASYFKGVAEGEVVANVGMGIKYTQNVNNVRVKKNDVIFTEAISSSALKSVADQMWFDGDTILYRPSESINGAAAVFADSVNKLEPADFAARYGVVPSELAKHIISNDTILSVVDDNAPVIAPVLNAAHGAEGEKAPLETAPKMLVKGDDGHYKFTLELDPSETVKYYRNEVRTRAGADQNPAFRSVRVTIECLDDFTPVSYTSIEEYDIAIPVLGAMSLRSELTETFYDFDKTDGVLPEEQFFKDHAGSASDGEITDKLSPADYLASAFASYLDGSKNLDICADIVIGDIAIKGVDISLNLGSMNVRAAISDLCVEYKDDNIYLTLGDAIRGYLPVSAVSSLIENETVAKLLGGAALPDFDKLLGGDILGTVFKNCEMTTENGVTCIRLPFDLGGDDEQITVDASLYINDDGLTLESITGTVKAFGLDIALDVTPADDLVFPEITDDYADLSPIVDFVPDILDYALGKTYGIKGDVTVSGKTLGVDAYIDIRNGIALDADISVFGARANIKYIGETMYAKIGNVMLKASGADIKTLVSKVAELLGVDMSFDLLSVIKPLLPGSLDAWLGVAERLTVTDTALSLSANIIGVPINIALGRNENGLTSLGFDASIDLFGFKAAASANLELSSAPRDIELDGTYTDIKDILPVLDALPEYINAESYGVTINGSVAVDDINIVLDAALSITRGEKISLEANGSVKVYGLDIDFTYAEDTVYLSVGNISLKLDINDIETLLPKVRNLLSSFGITMSELNIELPKELNIESLLPTVLEAIKSITANDGAISVGIELNGNTVNADIDIVNGKLSLNGELSLGDTAVSLDLSGAMSCKDVPTITAPAGDHIDVKELSPALDVIADIIQTKSLGATLSFTLGNTSVNARVAATFEGGLKLAVEIPELKIDGMPAMAVYLAIDGQTAYVSISGNINAALNFELAELEVRALEALSPVLPDGLAQKLQPVLGLLENAGKPGNNKPDAPSVATKLIGAIKRLVMTNGKLDGEFAFALGDEALDVSLCASPDLSDVSIGLNLKGTAFTASVTALSAGETVDIRELDYIALKDILPAIRSVMPLVNKPGYTFKVSAEAFGAKINGTVALGLTKTEIDGKQKTDISLSASLTVGDVPLKAVLKSDKLYVTVASSLNVVTGTTSADLEKLLNTVAAAIPDVDLGGLKSFITGVGKVDIADSLKLELYNGENGGIVGKIGLNGVSNKPLDIVAEIYNKADTLDKVVLTLGGKKPVTVTLNARTFALGTLSGIDISTDAFDVSAAIDILSTSEVDIKVPADDFIDIDVFASLLSPVMNTVTAAEKAKTVRLDLASASITTSSGKTSELGGYIEIALGKTMSVRADLELFKNTESATHVYITYTGGIVYISAGAVRLSFDTATDIRRLFDIASEYLPDYLNAELAKILKLNADTDADTDLSSLISRVKALSKAKDVDTIMPLLFGFEEGGKSFVKTLLDVANIFMSNDELTVNASIMGLSLNITPSVDTNTLAGARLSSDVLGMKIAADIKLSLYETETTVNAPADAADYVSIIEFLHTVDTAVRTLTTTDENKNVTFEISDFEFDYENIPADDEKKATVYAKNTDGKKALVFKIASKKDKDGNPILNEQGKPSYSADGLELEAHLDLTMPETFGNAGTITLSLYVKNKAAVLDYYENNTKLGERITIDFDSAMQILSAVFEILNVSDSVTDQIFSEYRAEINTSVFESMDIAGLDNIKTVIESAVGTLNDVQAAVKDIEKAWNIVKTAGSVKNLKIKLPELEKIVGGIKLFKKKTNKTAVTETDVVDGALFNKIVNGVTLTKGESTLSADVLNKITTGADGTANITVTESAGVINKITVTELNVKTALVKTASAAFRSGIEVNVPDVNTVPLPQNTDASDFSNIKHLLFDVLNTANLGEFEIGGDNTKIHCNLNIIKIININFDIGISAEVKLFNKEERKKMGLTVADAEAEFKTAAVVELTFKDVPFDVIPNCTTRLIFYDNIFYINGLRCYKAGGTVLQKNETETINVTYTLDEFLDMINNHMDEFLYKFVFYLAPLSRSFAWNDLQAKIVEAATPEDGNGDGSANSATPTLAKVYKGYSYNDGKHSMTIGLKELTGNSMLGDVGLTITGKNDTDGNLLDNYLSSLTLKTSLINNTLATLAVDLSADLVNVREYKDENGINRIESGGLSDTVIQNISYSMETLLTGYIGSVEWKTREQIKSL